MKLLWAFALVLAVACGDIAATAPQQVTGGSQSISIALGSNVDIVLQNVGPGTYLDPLIINSAVEYIGTCPVGAAVPAGVTQCFRFHAQVVGQSLIDFKHTQEPGAPPVADVVDTVEVF